MLFKTALKNIKKDPLMNIIGFVQLIAIFMVATVMMSTISIRYRTYDPVKDIISGKGFYASFYGDLGATDYKGNMANGIFLTDDELTKRMDSELVIYVTTFYATTFWTYPNVENNGHNILLYDNEMMSRYTPVLKSGRWVSSDSDIFEIVITDENDFGWDLGDTISVDMDDDFDDSYLPVEAKVVGIVESNSEIFGYVGDGGNTYRIMYDTHNAEHWNTLGSPTILASAENFERIYPNYDTKINSALFIYGNDASNDFVEEQIKLARQFGACDEINFETMNEKSLDYLRDELLKLIPVIVVLLILVVVSSISVSAIATRKRLKDYAKYYVLGLQWKQCAAVNLFQALITGAAALVISIAALFVISLTPLSETITIIVNSWLVFALLGIFALYLVFSMIMPLLMLRSTTPKALLQSE